MTRFDHAAEDGGDEFDALLVEARQRALEGTPLRVAIRDLLTHVGAERRGVRVLAEIQAALDEHDLRSEPPFSSGWVGTEVELRLKPDSSDGEDSAATDVNDDVVPAAQEVALTVRTLESATAGVTSIERNSDLHRARALMLRYDFSQLAVMSGARQVVGAVSWESMALAAVRGSDVDLRSATVPAQMVELDDDLIALIPTIAEKGFVFVVGRDRTLSGIITTADLSLQFATLAGPFLVIGEIERRLRQTLTIHFSVEDLGQVRDPADTQRTISSADDLTLGETLRLLENPANWDRLRWPVDRAEFVAALNDVKDIRNEVMHFGPDPLSKSQEQVLLNFVNWLRAMESPAG
jgi:predicted transcriptional regulator